MAKAMSSKLEPGMTLEELFGSVDTPKVKSSLDLIRRVVAEMNDMEIVFTCGGMLGNEGRIGLRVCN